MGSWVPCHARRLASTRTSLVSGTGGGSRLPSCVCHPSPGITLFSRALVPFLGADIRDQELGVTRDSAVVSGHERCVLPVPWSGAQRAVGRKAGRPGWHKQGLDSDGCPSFSFVSVQPLE